MNVGSWMIWGFVATVAMTLVTAGAQELRLTRANLPYLLGTMITTHRSRAKAYGIGVHLLNGYVFSIIYVLAFEALGRATWWLGAMAGLVHVLFVLIVAMPALPGIHPRMASEYAGPVAERKLEPPGVFALHYGIQTPIVMTVAHLLFGAILGAFYRL